MFHISNIYMQDCSVNLSSKSPREYRCPSMVQMAMPNLVGSLI